MKIVVGDKEIEINEETLAVLRRYKRTEMTLEQLASALGLASWEEAYELLKKVPLWVLDVDPSMWKVAIKKTVQKESS
ncbi:MAG: hypothetical protein NZ902_05105 [Acidilobaceae archaeon]|nr:hypothetical protein [Acidilobaceae archaeon]MCX8165945.1 hypothetical protein [Acidilobaceae archaeon]MDW7974588.1 hypothetical protein [Sulfolobales archaeon]